MLTDNQLDSSNNLPKLTQKTLTEIKLVNAGVPIKEAMQIVNNKDNISNAAVSKFKAKYQKYSVTHPNMVKLANNQVKRILQGESRQVTQQKVNKQGEVVDYIETIVPSDTNILAAATMVYDRVEPIIKQDQTPTTTINYLDLSSYRVHIDNTDNNHNHTTDITPYNNDNDIDKTT